MLRHRIGALLGALSLALAPGVGGLSAWVAAESACDCDMGPDCPMCAARRLHARGGEGTTPPGQCPCQLQAPKPTAPGLASGALALEPACLTAGWLLPRLTPSPGFAERARPQRPPLLEIEKPPPRSC